MRRPDGDATGRAAQCRPIVLAVMALLVLGLLVMHGGMSSVMHAPGTSAAGAGPTAADPMPDKPMPGPQGMHMDSICLGVLRESVGVGLLLLAALAVWLVAMQLAQSVLTPPASARPRRARAPATRPPRPPTLASLCVLRL